MGMRTMSTFIGIHYEYSAWTWNGIWVGARICNRFFSGLAQTTGFADNNGHMRKLIAPGISRYAPSRSMA